MCFAKEQVDIVEIVASVLEGFNAITGRAMEAMFFAYVCLVVDGLRGPLREAVRAA